jgi:hypothetical protein
MRHTMIRTIKALSIVIVCVAVIYSCVNDKGKLPPKPAAIAASACDSIRYSNGIKTIIDANCATSGCHDNATKQNGFDFSIYSTVQGQATNGRIMARAIEGNPTPMPPSGKLPQSQLDSLKCWIEKGAPQ